MTGPWLIVKWVGLGILLCYLALSAGVAWRFRQKLSQLRIGLILPIVIGNFSEGSLPGIIESVVFTRVCFLVANAIYVCGIAVLIRGLSQEGQKALFKESGAEDYVQPLKLS